MPRVLSFVLVLATVILFASARRLPDCNDCYSCETECDNVCGGAYDWSCSDVTFLNYDCECLGNDAVAGWLIAVIVIGSIFIILIISALCFRRWRRRAYYYEVTTQSVVPAPISVATTYQQGYQPQPYLAAAPGPAPSYATVVYT